MRLKSPNFGRGEGLTLVALLLFAAAALALPLGLLLRAGLAEGGAPSLAPLWDALGSGSVQRALRRSLESAAISALGATALGALCALAVGLTDIRGKGALVFLLLLPMMIPPHVTAVAWVQALGPASPPLRALGLAPELGASHPLHSPGGVWLLLTFQHAPLAFLVVLAAIRALPREMAEAARSCGAGATRLLRRVILPLLAPALIAAFALAFVSALGNFGIPALLGIPARYATLPVLIWQKLASFGPSVLRDVGVLAAALALVAAAAVGLQALAQRHAGRARLIGPPQPPMRLRLGPWRGAAEAGLALYVAVTLALPLVSLVATALIPTYGAPLTWETLTLRHFEEVLFSQTATLRAFANSSLTAGVAAILLAGMAAVLGWFLARRERSRRAPAAGIALLAELSYAIPGLVISIAFILAFLRPLPLVGVSIYNTLAIIGLAYLCAFFAVALKPAAAASAQLDPSLEDAARAAGAGFGRRMARIHLPLCAPAAASGAILVFLTAYNEVTVSALLWSTGTETIGTVIFNYEDGGYTTLAAAMSTVTVAATAGLMALLDRAGRRAPRGVVPWRV